MAQTPTLARRVLAQKLRRQRIAAGVTQDQAAAEVDRDATTIGRWEQGHAGARRRDIQDLAKLYGASGAETARMTALLMQAGERGIWEGTNVPARLRVLYESEQTADTSYYLDHDYIPGLLQTPEYLTAAQAVRVDLSPSEADAVQHSYHDRQERTLYAADPPRLNFVFGQSALMYIRHLPDVCAGQIARLREADEMPHVDIRVITRLHAAMDGAFTLVDPGPDGLLRPFIFLESADGRRYVETPDVVSTYLAAFRAVQETAIPLKEFLDDAWKVA